ncbi:hypothetical protein EJ08DRAFT_699743 [Tothia fuscella]|uniref:Uncharacterized protein n=1 Tax=Tothia fuscella TaxID=1048955 RepID=A0A9P4TVT4_9PEZI|nr:hypothetical protein EJ08DRAFT_699743 [Tothia fuscella]
MFSLESLPIEILHEICNHAAASASSPRRVYHAVSLTSKQLYTSIISRLYGEVVVDPSEPTIAGLVRGLIDHPQLRDHVKSVSFKSQNDAFIPDLQKHYGKNQKELQQLWDANHAVNRTVGYRRHAWETGAVPPRPQDYFINNEEYQIFVQKAEELFPDNRASDKQIIAHSGPNARVIACWKKQLSNGSFEALFCLLVLLLPSIEQIQIDLRYIKQHNVLFKVASSVTAITKGPGQTFVNLHSITFRGRHKQGNTLHNFISLPSIRSAALKFSLLQYQQGGKSNVACGLSVAGATYAHITSLEFIYSFTPLDARNRSLRRELFKSCSNMEHLTLYILGFGHLPHAVTEVSEDLKEEGLHIRSLSIYHLRQLGRDISYTSNYTEATRDNSPDCQLDQHFPNLELLGIDLSLASKVLDIGRHRSSTRLSLPTSLKTLSLHSFEPEDGGDRAGHGAYIVLNKVLQHILNARQDDPDAASGFTTPDYPNLSNIVTKWYRDGDSFTRRHLGSAGLEKVEFRAAKLLEQEIKFEVEFARPVARTNPADLGALR